MGSDELKLNIGKKEGVQPVADGKETVLIVDDSKMSRKVLRDILEKQGYQIVGEAVDGVEGVNEYNRLKPDIVTMDVTMPNMDGILALSKIIENDPNAKVVMISAAGQQKRIIEAIKIGAKKFITKPFDQEDIIKNLSDL
ncbi:MAG: response regulator [Lachnospiraceae bacterium]|nr:response regulator [Lachnospiraceae bacterium]